MSPVCLFSESTCFGRIRVTQMDLFYSGIIEFFNQRSRQNTDSLIICYHFEDKLPLIAFKGKYWFTVYFPEFTHHKIIVFIFFSNHKNRLSNNFRRRDTLSVRKRMVI